MARKPRSVSGGTGGENPPAVAPVSSTAVNSTAALSSEPSATTVSTGSIEAPSQALSYSVVAPEDMAVIVPNEDYRYLVTGEQIDSLAEGGRKKAFDYALAFIFGGIGFSQNAIKIALDVVQGEKAAVLDMLLAFSSVALIAIGVSKFSEHKRIQEHSDETKDKIKNGKRVKVIFH